MMFSPTDERAETTGRLSDTTRAHIAEQFFQRLDAVDSPLAHQPDLRALLARQVDHLLDDITTGLAAHPGPSAESLHGAAEFGRHRTAFDIHPTEALHAAALFQELALPPLVHELLPEQPSAHAVIRLALLVNDAVTTQIALGCVGYIKFLREKLHGSHQDERRRLARELHDRVSHEIAVALLSLELYESAPEPHADTARDKLRMATQTLRGTLGILQELSGELRTSVSGTGLEAAIRAFLPTAVPDGITAECTVTGDATQLPTPVAEELYYIVREAVRNAARHSDPHKIWIELEVTRSMVRASVRDDGAGFDVTEVSKLGTSGLTSIRERAELLGGIPEFLSFVGDGTTVSVSIPLATWIERA